MASIMWQGKRCIMYREFLGHYFVSGLRTLIPKNLKKPKNLKHFIKTFLALVITIP